MAELGKLEIMDSGIAPPGRLFSWVDVDDHLTRLATAGVWPDWLVAADGWWDCLELVTAKTVAPEAVKSWLDEVFGTGSAGWVDGELLLGLDDPRTMEFTGLRVELSMESEDTGGRGRRVPLLREKHITRYLAEPLSRPMEPFFADDVQVLAFHSFKGGVGRTVHAVAVADRLAKNGGKVLLVDADLEAPGITWMHTEQGGQCDFSYEDFITLLQGAEGHDWTGAVDVAGAYLPNQQAGHYPGGGSITVMPSSRRPTLVPPRIEPADLLSPGRPVYFVTEALAALGARLGVDTVVVDLRAGASELSAPVLLDPRVQRVFVTTLSHQSLAGTEMLVRQLGQKAPALQGVDPATSIIITQYRMDAHTVQVDAARRALSAALGAALGGSAATADDTDTVAVDTALFAQPVLSPFREELLALPSSWDAVLEVVSSCGVADGLESILPAPSLRAVAGAAPLAHAGVDYAQLRGNLARTAGNLVYAEQSGLSSAGGFLVTEPLRRLLADHRTELPQVLVVGAKGAGKTFMYAKACAARTWQTFAGQSGITGVTVEAPIVPVLESANLESTDFEPQDLRDEFAAQHGDGAHLDITVSSADRLKAGLGKLSGQDELGWRSLWLECLAVSCGLEVSDGTTPEEALISLGRRARAVFVIDGLEDLLQNLDSDAKRTALRVLLIDVLGWLRSLRGRPFGLVVFVRRDLVTGAVRQNSGQLLGRFSHYALHWSKEEALRLALWVTAHADALPEPVPLSRITDLSEDELINSLIQVWGWKMGSEKSREARSHLWVPAALGDFNGQVQARDVVMFLATAAKNSEQYNDTVEDRVLVPTAMRKALLECSRNKIVSVGEEDKEIGKLLAHMQGLGHSVTVPFELEQVDLTTAQADLLIESGVFSKGQDGRFWVPEIYRHGLGFNSERRARVLW
ncbi:AAA family ATPase [Kitasatospora sp. NBC_01246]|uniref:KGGVGR-motif variant AAA ATPase n=1 Tax=Kitasatospora sp. NBC_01246 TaxID=2903570 RepID=UPI002E2F582A|nr:AAA family ATPase [Kitasatospora sp. NBC_01246]